MSGAGRFGRLGRARYWRLAAGVLGAVALALLVVLPVDSPAWVTVSLTTEAVAVVVFLVAAIRMPARARFVWWALWACLALTFLADVVYDVLLYHVGVSPFPSWADALYVASYVPQIAALLVLVKQRQRVWDRQAWIDSAVITVASVSVAATFVLLPMLSQSTPSDTGTYLALAYPLLDLVVLAILIRLTVGGGRPMTPLLLLTASVAATLSADLVYNGLAANGLIDQSPGWLEALFAAGMVLMAAAATEPDAASIGHPSAQGASMMSPSRTVALGAGALTAPLLLALGTWDISQPDVLFLAIATIIANVLVIWRILLLLKTVERQADRLDALARTDALTGLPNRRSWDFELVRATAAARASGEPVTLAIADIDRFKDYNDEYGHLAGDALLAECARCWRAALDPSVFLARYGGEEFGVILAGQWSRDALGALEAMRRATPAPVTLSAGFALHDSDEAVSASVQRADQALYTAKVAGRDRVLDAASASREMSS